ncbi:MAG: hydrolase [Candidatus Saccharibacteria bacterium]|nr:hydrolase [Candidatus Saccharibacteria bacterium]
MNRRIAVRAIVQHEGKLLCVRHKPYSAVFAATAKDSVWATPGGGLDSGEALIAGVEREMIEETGIKPVVGQLLYIKQFVTGDTEHLEFFFHVTNAEDYLKIDLATTTHGASEIAEIAFVDPKATNILPKFLATEPVIEKVLSPSPPTIFTYL